MGFELGSLGPQAGLLPIEPPLLVTLLFAVVKMTYKAGVVGR